MKSYFYIYIPNCTEIVGDVEIRGGDITNLNGLSVLTSIGGYLWIIENNALTSLTGLDNIESSTIENLYIFYNSLLSTCEILSICNYLGSPNGNVTIENDFTGCNSPEEVKDSCIANAVNLTEQFSTNKLSIYPNPFSSTITIETPTTQLKNTFLTIYYLNGQQIITEPITEPQTVVDISGLPSGVCFVKVVDNEKVMMGKVIKQ